MGSHSVTCHPAEVTFPPLPQLKLVLDLVTPEGYLDLVCWLHIEMVYRPKTVTQPSTNWAPRGLTEFICGGLSCGFTSHSTQNRSFRRRFPKPVSWLGMEKKLNLTQQKHAFSKEGMGGVVVWAFWTATRWRFELCNYKSTNISYMSRSWFYLRHF